MISSSLCLDECDENDFTNILVYISQFGNNLLLQKELKNILAEVRTYIGDTHKSQFVKILLPQLDKIEQKCIFINNFKININNVWFFKLIILAEFKEFIHNKNGSFNENLTLIQKRQILHQAMLTFQVHKVESLLLLQLIENLIKKDKDLISPSLAFQLILFSQLVAVSPLEGFKHYAQSFSKFALLHLDFTAQKWFFDFDLLPIRGVETSELVLYYRRNNDIKHFSIYIIAKIIQMFSNNIENREGGFLYRVILFEDFSLWKKLVWTEFNVKFQTMDFEGEFLQSLIKYWIPHTVSAYKKEFLKFIFPLSISNHLKACILLECRKKGLIEEYNDELLFFIDHLLKHMDTSILGLKILSCFPKKILVPSRMELQLVMCYIYSQKDIFDKEELKCLHSFLSQIGYIGSVLDDMSVNSSSKDEILLSYGTFIRKIILFGLNQLKYNTKSLGAQLLIMVYKLADGKNNIAENFGQNLYFDLFPKEEVCKQVEKVFNGNEYISELADLVELVGNHKFCSNLNLLKFLNDNYGKIDIKTAESVKNFASIVTRHNDSKINLDLYQKLCQEISIQFQNVDTDIKCIFKGVLLFEALLVVSRYIPFSEGYKFYNFEKHLKTLESILQTDGDNINSEKDFSKVGLNCTDQEQNIFIEIKVKEALFNNTIKYLLQDQYVCQFLSKPKIINILIKIIQTSNMRRPTTLSADSLKIFFKMIDECYKTQIVDSHDLRICHDDQCYKIKLLHKTIADICKIGPDQHLAIRRNPECRLIIHALCQSDTHSNKPLLNQTVVELLKILSQPNQKDSSVASAFHCIEILISDNTLHDQTLKFVPDIMLQSVHHFKNRNWIVRNGNIQLARSLIDRFLGVLIGPCNRTKSIEDVFYLFPEMITVFVQTLTVRPLTDSALLVMQFFSESHIKNRMLRSDLLEETKNMFLSLFIKIIKENSDHYGKFAVRAYISLCLKKQIPFVIEDIVEFIIGNFSSIKQNVSNFVLLLHELYDKYADYTNEFPVKEEEHFKMYISLDKLRIFLRQLNTTQFDFLLLKVLTKKEILSAYILTLSNKEDFLHRIWLHNNIPFLVVNSELEDLPELLNEILVADLLDCMHLKILSIIVDRYNSMPLQIIQKIFHILVKKMISIESNRKYLHLCYYNVIFSFFRSNPEIGADQSFIKEITACYVDDNVYKKLIYNLLLTRVHNKTEKDKMFIKRTIRYIQNMNLQNPEMADAISETLGYIYLNVFCDCDKYILFKIAGYLLIEYGLSDFISFISKCKIPNPSLAVVKLLNFEILSKCFLCPRMPYKFVMELYNYFFTNENRFTNNNKTYFVEEKHIFVDRHVMDKVVFKFVHDFKRKEGSSEWFHDYIKLYAKNK